jgi:hypothetical protein
MLEKYCNSPLAVAEALILGEIKEKMEFIGDIVSPVILEAARIRLEALGKLAPEHIKPAITNIS